MTKHNDSSPSTVDIELGRTSASASGQGGDGGGAPSSAFRSASGSSAWLNGGEVDLAPGTKVGDYEIIERIGAGGFGAVFKAEHPLIGKTVAVKVLHPNYSSQPQMVSRFIAEARAVNQIQHPNIIDIFNFGTLDDQLHYYVMEYLEGESLQEFLSRVGKVDVATALRFTRPIGQALQAAHGTGIAHRDLKADNILLVRSARDGAVEPKLLDFGIAKLLNDEERGHRTREGTPIGTPGYMSPEQCMGDRDVDHRTDIYAFGILVYRMLTGKMPFSAPTAMRIIMAHINMPPPPLREIDPTIPASIDHAVLGMLDKSPDGRPQTMVAALQSLESAARAAGFDVPMDSSSLTVPAPGLLSPSTWSAGPTHDMGASVGGHQAGVGTEDTVGDAAAVATGPTASSDVSNAPSASGTQLGVAPPSRAVSESAMRPAGEPSRGRGGLVAAVAIVLGSALAMGLWFGLNAGDDGSEAEVAAPETTAAEAADDSAAGAAPAAVAPAAVANDEVEEPAAPASPPLPALVTVDIEGPPDGTEVYGPSGLLGLAPGAIQLPYAEAEVTLTFKVDGYETVTHTLAASADTAIAVEMKPKPRKRSRRTRKPPRRGGDPAKGPNKRDALDSPF